MSRMNREGEKKSDIDHNNLNVPGKKLAEQRK
jgi:hypothetical protein